MIINIENPFDTSKTITMTAHSEGTRNGFRHLASSVEGCRTVDVKQCYLNRTWESYTFQTVLHKLAWAWLVKNTGWNPKTKRDSAKFNAVYEKMVADIDAKAN